MSIGSLGIVGSLAGMPSTLKSSEVDKTHRDAADAARQKDTAARAESAEGVGETEEDAQAGERDADGRRLWERQPKEAADKEEAAASIQDLSSAKDPEGISGNILDLSG